MNQFRHERDDGPREVLPTGETRRHDHGVHAHRQPPLTHRLQG